MSRSRTTQDGEVFPGSERAREAFGSLPTIASEMVGNMNVGGEAIPLFPFVSWSVSNGFKYPLEAIQMLKDCGSAAEAFGDPAECWRQVDAILDSRQAP